MRSPRSAIYLCVLSVILCVILGGLLIWTGQRVSDVEQNIQVKNQNLLYEQERLRVLRAEWSHLNSPQRLDELMEEYRRNTQNADDTIPTRTWQATPAKDDVNQPDVTGAP